MHLRVALLQAVGLHRHTPLLRIRLRQLLPQLRVARVEGRLRRRERRRESAAINATSQHRVRLTVLGNLGGARRELALVLATRMLELRRPAAQLLERGRHHVDARLELRELPLEPSSRRCSTRLAGSDASVGGLLSGFRTRKRLRDAHFGLRLFRLRLLERALQPLNDTGDGVEPRRMHIDALREQREDGLEVKVR